VSSRVTYRRLKFGRSKPQNAGFLAVQEHSFTPQGPLLECPSAGHDDAGVGCSEPPTASRWSRGLPGRSSPATQKEPLLWHHGSTTSIIDGDTPPSEDSTDQPTVTKLMAAGYI